MNEMTPEPAPFLLRKKTDPKISLIVGVTGCGICLFIDWIIHGITRSSTPISSVSLVPVLSLFNAFGGFSVWRKIEVRHRWIIGWAILSSVGAFSFIPHRSGPFNAVNTLLWILGISLCTYFAIPVQRLVIKVEREALKKTLRQ